MKNFNLIRNDEKKEMKEVRKTFVTGYDFNKENNTIDVHFADGSTCSYEYNEKTVQNVVSKMEQQVIDASNSDNVKKYKEDGSEASSLIPLTFYLGGMLTVLSYLGSAAAFTEGVRIVNEQNDLFLPYAFLFPVGVILAVTGSITPISIGKLIYNGVKESNAYRDYKKSKLYLDNKDLINRYVLTEKPILKGLTLKVKKQIKASNGTININDISKMSLRDLRRLKKNLESKQAQEELFTLREQILTEEEANQLVKTK